MSKILMELSTQIHISIHVY